MFSKIDSIVQTMYNEPSLGLFFTQQYVHNTFPVLLNQLDKLHDNKKKLSITLNELCTTERELTEITSLKGDFSFKMLTKISAINYLVTQKEKERVKEKKK